MYINIYIDVEYVSSRAHLRVRFSLSLSLARAFSKRRAREASSPSRIAHYFLSRRTHNTTPISSRFFLFSLPSFLERTESYNRTEKRCSTIFITTVPQRLHTIASYIYLHCKCPTLLMSRVIIVDDGARRAHRFRVRARRHRRGFSVINDINDIFTRVE